MLYYQQLSINQKAFNNQQKGTEIKKILTSIFIATALATPQCFGIPKDNAYTEKVKEIRILIEDMRALGEEVDDHNERLNQSISFVSGLTNHSAIEAATKGLNKFSEIIQQKYDEASGHSKESVETSISIDGKEYQVPFIPPYMTYITHSLKLITEIRSAISKSTNEKSKRIALDFATEYEEIIRYAEFQIRLLIQTDQPPSRLTIPNNGLQVAMYDIEAWYLENLRQEKTEQEVK